MKLYEIASEYNALINLMDSDEIDEQALHDTLEGVEGEFEIKAENYAKIMRNMAGEIEQLKAEEQRLSARRKSLEANEERLKKALYEAMKSTGKEKFKTPLFSFNIAKNGGKLPVILDVDADALPTKLTVIQRKPNLDVIRELLESGKKTKYAHLGERGESLRIR